MKPTREYLRRYTGYVEQFDTLLPILTGTCFSRAVCGIHSNALLFEALREPASFCTPGRHPPRLAPSPLPPSRSPPPVLPLPFSPSPPLPLLFPPSLTPPLPHSLLSTVHEMLMYTAELKRPMSESLASKREAVEELVMALGLDVCRY